MKQWKKVVCMVGAAALIGIAAKEVKVIAAYGENNDRDSLPYVMVPDYYLRQELAWLTNTEYTDLYENYGLIERSRFSDEITRFSSESEAYSLEGLQNLVNLTTYDTEGTSAVDYRPLEKLTNLTSFVDYSSPAYSIEFFKEMKQLERIHLELVDRASSGETDYALRPIADLTVLNGLDNLSDLFVSEENRYAQTVVMKTGMTQYQLVDPVILSKHFDSAQVEYLSYDANFSCENGVMTWTELDSTVSELQYSWNAVVDNAEGIYEYNGQTTIPLVWK